MTSREGLVYTLPYGRTAQLVVLPPTATITVLEPAEEPATSPPEELIATALAEPIGSLPLVDCIRGAGRMVVVISDRTRPCPSAQMLPPLLDTLNAAGVPDDRITVLCALGCHRRQTDRERRALVSQAVWQRVKVVDSNPEDTCLLGVTTAGTPIEIDHRLLDADAVIVLGNVEYHYFAGYTGGLKGIVPGCASLRTISANHSLMTRPGAVAASLQSNPVRMDLEEAARSVNVPFILNAVLDGEHRIASVVAGDPITAHRAACRVLDARNKARLSAPAPVVIASAGGYPKDIDLYQAQKALDNAVRALVPGGTLVLVAACEDGLGHPIFARWMLEESDPTARIQRLENGFVLGGHKAVAVSRAMLHAGQIALVSSLPADEVKRMGFVPYLTAQAAVNAALACHGSSATIVVMPHAAETLPILNEAL